MYKLRMIPDRYIAILEQHAESNKLRFYVLHSILTIIFAIILIGIPAIFLNHAGESSFISHICSMLLDALLMLIIFAEGVFGRYFKKYYGKSSEFNDCMIGRYNALIYGSFALLVLCVVTLPVSAILWFIH